MSKSSTKTTRNFFKVKRTNNSNNKNNSQTNKVVTSKDVLFQLCEKKNLDGQGADEEEYQANIEYWMEVAKYDTVDGIIQEDYYVEKDYAWCPHPKGTICQCGGLSPESINRIMSTQW